MEKEVEKERVVVVVKDVLTEEEEKEMVGVEVA